MVEREIIKRRIDEYLSAEKHDYFRLEVKTLIDSYADAELFDRFYRNLAFGTGGMRGVIGGGFNRMNPYVVRRATQGLANYIVKTNGNASCSAVIAYDSRKYSDLFAREAALVLAGNGIKTYLFTSLRPTPELSFAVRHLRATAGIVITASHNPPAYNGYKVYWSDGGQIVPPHDAAIIAEVDAVAKIMELSTEEAKERGLLVMIDKEVDEAYLSMVKQQCLRPHIFKIASKSLPIVYTPLNGSGAVPVVQVLSDLGVDVRVVEEQCAPDGNFPTLKVPNPEEAAALEKGIELARRQKAALVMATDPDADRLGIAVAHQGDFILVNGNQLGSLLLEYILCARSEDRTLPAQAAIVKTIVTTELQRRIAEAYGVQCFDVLTGFKYIAEKIAQFERNASGPRYVFGGEESYGYLVCTDVRDKDAVSAAVVVAEMAIYYHQQGKTLIDHLEEIYTRYGYFQEVLVSGSFEGAAGMARMEELMERLRCRPPSIFAKRPVVAIKDYRDRIVRNTFGDTIGSIELPAANVIQLVLDDDTIVTVRPSGTEPKIKLYASCCSAPKTDLLGAKEEVRKKIESVSEEMRRLIASVT